MTNEEREIGEIKKRAGGWIAAIVPSALGGGYLIQARHRDEMFLIREALSDIGFESERYAGKVPAPLDSRKATVYAHRRV